ncbi:DUF2683 family protein [Chryseobacterium koreense]|uniref:DUF2683 family protein n=1 Tax=Chryseobacterium koreense TaxID=232216 RepID=UPI0026EFD033|nr:DUF2683 family protein [Chryseobacterium koreense]
MESITVYPRNKKQQSLLESLLIELKIRFETSTLEETKMTEKKFIEKIDKSIKEAETGKSRRLSKDKQSEFLGL